jgi:hypothetical protein
MPRPAVLVLAAACALPLASCGGGSDAPSAPPVRITVTDPADLGTVRDGSVDIRGTVRPASASVTVRGERAEVSGGTFHARVDLAAGVNVIDVLASDGDARPATTAVRVRRIVTVDVPDVAGLSPADARKQLQGAGLKVDTQGNAGGGDFLDQLLGGKPKACETSPAAGETVDAGSTVQLIVSRSC